MELNLTKRQWMLLIIFNIGYFFSGICNSVQAPFYPREADEKGVPPSQYGFVFGVYNLTAFIYSPFCGILIAQIGAMFLSYVGLFIAGITSILFGVLDKIYDADTFFAFSMIIRILESIGTTSIRTAGFSIVANEFSDNKATAFASLQSFLAMGVVLGPAFGGVLYQLEGFMAPFLSTGILLLIASGTLAILFSHIEETFTCNQSRKGFFLLLKQPEILLASAASFGAFMNIAFFQALIEPHMRKLSLDSIHTGLMFVTIAMAHSCAAPVWGVICDKLMPPQFVWSIGAMFNSVALLLIGPAPYFPIQLSLITCIFALIIHGIGQSAEVVSSFHCLGQVAIKTGYPDDVNTYGITSALFSAACSLGGFVAPLMGGFLFDKIGFPWAVHVLLCFHISVMIVTLLYNFLNTNNNFPQCKKKNSHNADKIPILKKEIPLYKTNEN